MNNVAMELKRMRNYVSDLDESIPVVNFSELELKDLRSLTPYKVCQVIENNWLPNGLIAWKISENGRLSMIFFRGRAAIVTEIKGENLDISELLKKASTLCNIENKKIVFMCA